MDSFQGEIPKSRVQITLDLQTGGTQGRTELPLKLLVTGDFSAGKAQGPLAERRKIDINRSNFNSVLADLGPELVFAAENTLAGNGSEMVVKLAFHSVGDFGPERVARQIPELGALLGARNLLRDLKSSLLDDGAFRQEFEKILKDGELSARLRSDLSKIGTVAAQPGKMPEDQHAEIR